MDKAFKKGNRMKILLVTLSCLLFLATGYYLIFTLDVFRKGGNELDNEEEIVQQEEEGNIEQETTQFLGEYISATLPNGWSIEEYENGQGSTMLNTQETYTGLTGLKIFKEGIELFTMQAISGLGFAGCSNYAKFLDESTTYYQQILTDNEISGSEVTVHDFTNSVYSEFTWLGVPFRRIEKTYVYDVVPGNEYFESCCVFTLLSFQDITLYEIDDKYESSAYDFSPSSSASQEELLIIDSILESMSLVN